MIAHAPPLHAEEGDAFRYGGGVTVTYDSNLFRRSDASPDGAPSDTYVNAYGLLGFDKLWGRQRFYGDFIFGHVSYAEFSQLDYNRQDFTAGWQGNFPGDIGASLAWHESQSLASFSDLTIKRRNVITRDTLDAKLDVPVIANWHAVAGAGLERSRNSNAIDEINDRDAAYVEAGARYLTNYGNSIDLVYRELHSEYVNREANGRIDSEYTERTGDLRLQWQATGNNRLEGRVGFVRREHENLSYRDFSGPSFRLSDTWALGGSTTLVTSIYRTMGPAGDNEFDYAVTKGLRVAPAWQASSKLVLAGAVEWINQRYFGSYSNEVLNLPVTPSGREYKTLRGEVSLSYQAFRWLRTRFAYVGERRDADFSLGDYDTHTVSLDAQLSF